MLACACLAPAGSSAIMFGGMELHSRLGQPLSAAISVAAGPGERLDSGCFSLSRPRTDTRLSYLTQAVLTLEPDGAKYKLKITSARAIGEPYLKLLVQVDCGQGRYAREFIALIDPEVRVALKPQPVMAMLLPRDAGFSGADGSQPNSQGLDPGMAWDVRKGETIQAIAVGLFPRQPGMQDRMEQAIRDANPNLSASALDALLPEGAVIRVPGLKSLSFLAPQGKRLQSPQAESVEAAPAAASASASVDSARGEGEFLLKLSSGDLDMSLVGKMTAEQLRWLREKQSLLVADDQAANMLDLKDRIKQLESQITQLHAALGDANNRLAMSERIAAAPHVPPPEPEPLSPGMDWMGWLDNVSMRAMAGAALIGALLASIWWRWRRRQAEEHLDSELEHEFSHPIPIPQTTVQKIEPESEREPEPAVAATRNNDFDGEDFLNPTSIFDSQAETVTFTEAETVADEVDLYLAYGWVHRAVDLLQRYLENHPDDTQLWMKLLEIHSSQGMVREFEQLALRCRPAMEGNGSWLAVTKMGRQLDADNPLYGGDNDDRGQVVGSVALAEAPLREPEIPTLDTPLEFTLDKPPVPEAPLPEPEAETLNLAPLLPEFLESIKKEPEQPKKPG